MFKQTEIILVADHFYPGYTGGAELTTYALTSQCPNDLKITFIKSSQLNFFHIALYRNKFWIFTNIQEANLKVIDNAARVLNYTIVEYDFKFCKHRSPDKHEYNEGKKCDCKIDEIKLLFQNAKYVFFMSHKQREIFWNHGIHSVCGVLRSIFTKADLDMLDDVYAHRNRDAKKWLIVYSESWVKGASDAVRYAVANKIDYELIQDFKHDDLMKKLGEVKGLIYMPAGADTCPRMVIEAKLAGCELLLNDNVLHRDEDWFAGSRASIVSTLKKGPEIFWEKIRTMINVSE